jgi:hypothetical protein
MKQLGELKTDTKLSGLQKVEELRKLGASFDDKVSPLLNPDQQKKFQTMRAEMRRKMVEEMVAKALQKVESEVHLGKPNVHNQRGCRLQGSSGRTPAIPQPGARFSCEHHETTPPRAAGPLPVAGRGCIRRPSLHEGPRQQSLVEGDPPVRG